VRQFCLAVPLQFKSASGVAKPICCIAVAESRVRVTATTSPAAHMANKGKRNDSKTETVLQEFERVRSEAQELNRRQSERIDQARRRDRQVLIERRRSPRG
jgi:hypothetical protein